MASRLWRIGLIAIAIGAFLVVLTPVASLIVDVAHRAGDTGDALGSAQTWRLALNSLLLALAVTGTGVPLATLLAWLIARTALPGARFWIVLLSLPLALPSFLIAESYRRLLGLEGWVGAWLAITLITFPLAMLPLEAVLRRCSRDAEHAARAVGAGSFRAFWIATLPHLAPTLTWTSLLIALYALSDYGAVAMLGVTDVLTTAIESRRSAFDTAGAGALAMVLTGMGLLCLIGIGRIRGFRGPAIIDAHLEPRHQPVPLRRWLIPSCLFVAVVVVLSIGAPVFVVLRWWIDGLRHADIGVMESFSGTLAPAARSLTASLGAASFAALASIPIAILAHHTLLIGRHTWADRLGSLAFLGYGMPGVVIGYALVRLSVGYEWLYQSLTILMMGYFVRCYAEAVGPASSAAQRLPRDRLDAARNLGAGSAGAWLRIGAPALAPGVLAGSALAFLTVFKELPITLILRPTEFETLAIELFGALTDAYHLDAAPIAMVMIVMAAVVVWGLVGWHRE